MSHVVFIDQIIIFLQCFFISLIVFLLFIWSIKMRHSMAPAPTFYCIVFLACYFFILLYMMAIILRVYGRYIDHNNSPIYNTKISFTLQSKDLIHLTIHAAYYLSCIMTYVLLIGKLYITFKNTALSIVHNKLILSFIIVFISCSLSIMISMEYVIATAHRYNHQRKLKTQATLKFILLAIDILFNVFLFVTFQNKMKQLLLRFDSLRDDSRAMHETPLTMIDFRQQILLQLIAKNAILFWFALLFHQIYWLMSGTIDALFLDWSMHLELDEYTYIAQGFEGLVNALILYLTFDINQDEYYVLCRCCQYLCYKYFVVTTKRQIMKIYPVNPTQTNTSKLIANESLTVSTAELPSRQLKRSVTGYVPPHNGII
eukprot:243553_1